MRVTIGCDLGGTSFKSGLVLPDGQLFDMEFRPSTMDPDASAAWLVDRITTLKRHAHRLGATVSSTGVSVAGTVDEVDGVVLDASNLGWRDFELARRLEEQTALRTWLIRDSRAALLAEMRFGNAFMGGSCLYVPIGTGIGGAYVTNGVMQHGHHWSAGEIGHIRVRAPGSRCSCGRLGCIETIASGAAIARAWQSATGDTSVDAADCVNAVEAGDPAAMTIWSTSVAALAEALANATVVLDPEQILIGGGLAQAGSTLLELLTTLLATTLGGMPVPKVGIGALGPSAAVIGSGEYARTEGSPRIC